MRTIKSLLTLLLFFLNPFFSANAADFIVSEFVPKGEVKNIRQIRIRFSAPVVRMGNPRALAPIDGKCLNGGNGRWIDSSTWVYDYQETLKSGAKCQLKIKPSLQSLEGKTIQGESNFGFSTGQPQIESIAPNTYSLIEDDQYFAFLFDGEIRREEISKLFKFTVEGIGDEYAPTVVDERTATSIFNYVKNQWQGLSDSDEDYSAARDRRRNYEKTKSTFLVLKLDRRLPVGKNLNIQFNGKISQNFTYRVREEFKATFNCEREKQDGPCVPLSTMSVQFNEYIESSDLREIHLVDTKGQKIFPKIARGSKNPEMYVNFEPPFPEASEFKLVLPKGLKGESGRVLSNAEKFPLVIRTGNLPPLLKFTSSFGIIEAGPEAAIPVTLRELEPEIKSIVQKLNFSGQEARLDKKDIVQIFEFIREARRANSNRSIFEKDDVESTAQNQQKANKSRPRYSQNISPRKSILIPKPNGAAAFEVVGIPLHQPGFYVVEMVSPKLGNAINKGGQPYYVQTTALVTNLGLQIKYSSSEVMLWVTELNSAKSVAGAQLELFDCNGNSIAQGKTNSDGTAVIKVASNVRTNRCTYESLMYSGFFVVASKANDFTFATSEWDKGIEPYRFQVRNYGTPRSLHSVIARNLLRPGEVLHMKHFIRNNSLNGFSLPTADALPREIILHHTVQESEYKIPVTWDLKTGTAETVWPLPKGMKLGNWNVKLGKEYSDSSGSFSVENFRVPLMKGQIQAPTLGMIQPRSIPIQLGLEFLGGGPASGFDVKVKWNIADQQVARLPDDYNDFQMMNGELKEGLVRNGDESEGEGLTISKNISGTRDLKLDSKGAASLDISNFKSSNGLQSVAVEMNFKDPSGEYQSVGRTLTIYPSTRLVGVKAKSWSATKDKVAFEAVVVDTTSHPVSDAEVEMNLYTKEYISHRKRLLGGFYSYETYSDTKKLRSLCKGKTNAKGILFCETKINTTGQVYAVAKATDSNGRSSYANAYQHVYDPKESYWMNSNDGDRVDLIPSKKTFEPGEIAQFEFQSPFKNGRILLTVEREGIIEHQSIEIKGSGTQLLKVPVKENWAPNVFISAMAVRGRVEDYKPTALVDLGRPSFKMGLTEIKVGWKKHELKVQVNLDKAIYPVRAKAKATVSVTDSNNKPVQGEILLAAIDEGLLELQANSTWELLEAMMAPRGLQVRTASSYSEIVGRRHYGIKAVASGGDGGKSGSASKSRELFDTLLIWKGKVNLDKNGQTVVEIPINDSLTSFRVFVAAYADKDQFGSAQKSFQTTQDFMIFAGLPVVVRQGDQFVAEYTVRNASSSDQKLTATLDSNFKNRIQNQSPTEKNLILKPQSSERIEWTLQIPEGIDSVQTTMTLKNSSGIVVDKIKKSIEVRALNPVRIQQMSLEQIDGSKKPIYVDKVPNSVPNSTTVEVTLNPSLIGSRTSQEVFWKHYPYTCLEQKTSRAIALGKKDEWEKIAQVLDAYLDSDGLLKYFPDQSVGSEVLTAYILSIIYDAGWEISNLHLDRMGKALNRYLEGKLRRNSFAFADEEYRRLIIMEALSKYRLLSATHLNSVQPKSQIWPTAQVVTWYQILLMEKKIKQREQQLQEVESILKSRIYMSGAKADLRDSSSNFFWWLMIDPNATLARFFIASMNQPAWQTDLPKLIRGFIETQRNGSWYSTTSNAWGVLALKSYTNVFEKIAVTGETKLKFGPVTKSLKWTENKLSHEFKDIEKRETLSLEHAGTGKPWAFVAVKAAVPLQSSVVSGFKVEKTIEAVEQKNKSSWSRGDIARVRLKVTSQTDNGWVAVYDPIPSGATILGGNARQSSMIPQDENRMDELWVTAEERTYDSYRSYYYWFPKGTFDISYTIRLNQAGKFPLPATRVEAMYNADLYGESPNQIFNIKE